MVVVIRTGTSRICFAPDCTTCCWYIELVRIFTHICFGSYQLTLKAIGYFIFPSVLLFNLYRRYFLFFFFKISTRGLYISVQSPKRYYCPFQSLLFVFVILKIISDINIIYVKGYIDALDHEAKWLEGYHDCG